MLIIRVVFWMIRNNMMNVVCPFPPSKRQTSDEVGYYNADDCINHEVMSNAHMTCIMGSEDELMPEHS